MTIMFNDLIHNTIHTLSHVILFQKAFNGSFPKVATIESRVI